MSLVSMGTTDTLELFVENKIREKESVFLSSLVHEVIKGHLSAVNENELYTGTYKARISISREKINVELNVNKNFSLFSILKNILFLPTNGFNSFKKPDYKGLNDLLSRVYNQYAISKERELILNGNKNVPVEKTMINLLKKACKR